jgi:hypothetical protein
MTVKNMPMSAARLPGTRHRAMLTTAIAGIATLGLVLSTSPGPAVAAPLPALAERETWNLEERVEHGEDLWGKDAVEGEEPLVTHEMEPAPVKAPPLIVEGSPPTDPATDSGYTGGESLADLRPGQVTLEPATGKPARGEAGGLPVSLTASDTNKAARGKTAAGRAPGLVRVHALGAAAAERAGVTGVLLTVTGDAAGSAEAEAAPSVVDLAVDVSGLAVSPDWLSRARLVQLPAWC